MRRWEQGITFIVDVPELGVSTITIFDNKRSHIFSPETDDILSDYEAIMSGHIKLLGPANFDVFGFCKILE